MYGQTKRASRPTSIVASVMREEQNNVVEDREDEDGSYTPEELKEVVSCRLLFVPLHYSALLFDGVSV